MRKYLQLLVLIALVAIWIWAAWGTGVSLNTLAEGFPNMLDYLGGMFPPDFSILGGGDYPFRLKQSGFTNVIKLSGQVFLYFSVHLF